MKLRHLVCLRRPKVLKRFLGMKLDNYLWQELLKTERKQATIVLGDRSETYPGKIGALHGNWNGDRKI